MTAEALKKVEDTLTVEALNNKRYVPTFFFITLAALRGPPKVQANVAVKDTRPTSKQESGLIH